MAGLVAGLGDLGIEPVHRPAANIAFVDVAAAVIEAWQEARLDFYRLGKERIRLVTSFRSTPEEIDEALRRMAAACG